MEKLEEKKDDEKNISSSGSGETSSTESNETSSTNSDVAGPAVARDQGSDEVVPMEKLCWLCYSEGFDECRKNLTTYPMGEQGELKESMPSLLRFLHMEKFYAIRTPPRGWVIKTVGNPSKRKPLQKKMENDPEVIDVPSDSSEDSPKKGYNKDKAKEHNTSMMQAAMIDLPSNSSGDSPNLEV